MRVRDSTTSGAPPAAKAEPPGPRLHRRTIRSSPGFGPVLMGGAAGGELRVDRPTAGASPRAPPVRQIGTIERVLVGARGGEVEARVRIADGSPGGAEIRLIAAGGGRKIVAEILTASAGSRETLTNAMEEIRLRLRRRGIALSIAEVDGNGQEHDPVRRWW